MNETSKGLRIGLIATDPLRVLGIADDLFPERRG